MVFVSVRDSARKGTTMRDGRGVALLLYSTEGFGLYWGWLWTTQLSVNGLLDRLYIVVHDRVDMPTVFHGEHAGRR